MAVDSENFSGSETGTEKKIKGRTENGKPGRNRLNGLLATALLLMLAFQGLQFHYDVSPQEGVEGFLSEYLGWEDEEEHILPGENRGIISAIENLTPAYAWCPGMNLTDFRENLGPELVETLGIHADCSNGSLHLQRYNGTALDGPPGMTASSTRGKKDGIEYREFLMESYDGVGIPVMRFFPPGYDEDDPDREYPALMVFSGHGGYRQVNFEKDSYQHAAALRLAGEGYMVFSMENRGMGELSYLGDHLRMDAAARLTGGSWYGEIITDALFLLEVVYNSRNVDRERIGAAGVSTGGALSMFTAALDERVAAAYVQGYFGSYGSTFGTATRHCTCNNIPGILGVADMKDIAGAICPRELLIVNGEDDTFSPADAGVEFKELREIYTAYGAGDNVTFRVPDAGHEFSVEVAMEFFGETFMTREQ